MKIPSPSLLMRLRRAATYRACGHSWAAVAAKLGRSVDTCMHWQVVYRATWESLLREARDNFVGEITAEARETLRRHLRRKNVKTQREASKLLIAHSERLDARIAAQPIDLVGEYVEGLNAAQALELGAASDEAIRSIAAGRPRALGGRQLPP